MLVAVAGDCVVKSVERAGLKVKIGTWCGDSTDFKSGVQQVPLAKVGCTKCRVAVKAALLEAGS